MEMQNGPGENGVCSSESNHGGTDVWSCKESATALADHLVVMVHGILGRYGDFVKFDIFQRNLISIWEFREV